MRKFSFLSLCLSVIILATSCSKEAIPANQGSTAPIGNEGTSTSIVYSDWTLASDMTWNDTTVNADPFKAATWTAPELTQSMLENKTILIFARTEHDQAVYQMPAEIYAQGSTSEFEQFQSVINGETLTVLHTKSVDGVFEVPSITTNVSFRVVVVPDEMVNGSANSFYADQLKTMSYEQVANLFAIPVIGTNRK
ncbi:MAG TPA: hypothetical protein VM888_01965 [Chitinophagaceae bacterium]|nr:hypothetical protein [Chitinophagaceae bacterium]